MVLFKIEVFVLNLLLVSPSLINEYIFSIENK